MNNNIWVSSLPRLKPKGISDEVFETWFKIRMRYSDIESWTIKIVMAVITDSDWEQRLCDIFIIFQNTHQIDVITWIGGIKISLKFIFDCEKYSGRELWGWLGGALDRSGN